MNNSNFEFTHPEFLWLLVIVPFLGFWFFISRKRNQASLTVSSTKGVQEQSWIGWLQLALPVLKLIAFALLVIAMARPRNVAVTSKSKKNKGIEQFLDKSTYIKQMNYKSNDFFQKK